MSGNEIKLIISLQSQLRKWRINGKYSFKKLLNYRLIIKEFILTENNLIKVMENMKKNYSSILTALTTGRENFSKKHKNIQSFR